MAYPQMKRWSAAKLAKEAAFARQARDDNHPENIAWLDAIEAEITRRFG